MEDTGAATAPPQALAPAPAPTRRGAGAAALRGFELSADVFLCCFMGALLVCSATIAASVAARRACGRHSRAAAVAEELFVTAFQASVLLLQFIILARQQLRLLVLLGGRNEAREARIIGAGRGRQGARVPGHVTAHVFFVSFMSMMVGILLVTLAPAKESLYSESWLHGWRYWMFPSLCCVVHHHLSRAFGPIEVYLCQAEGGLKGRSALLL